MHEREIYEAEIFSLVSFISIYSFPSTKDINKTIEAQPFHSSNHQKWLPYQILGGKPVRDVNIDPQLKDMADRVIRYVVRE